jgi:hypothetical protein
VELFRGLESGKIQGTLSGTALRPKKDPDELVDVAAQNPAVIEKLQLKLDQYISSGWDITKGTFNEVEL